MSSTHFELSCSCCVFWTILLSNSHGVPQAFLLYHSSHVLYTFFCFWAIIVHSNHFCSPTVMALSNQILLNSSPRALQHLQKAWLIIHMFQLEAGVKHIICHYYFLSSNDQMTDMILLMGPMLMTFTTCLSDDTFPPTWMGVLEIWFDYVVDMIWWH